MVPCRMRVAFRSCDLEMLFNVTNGRKFEDPLRQLQYSYIDPLAVIRSELIRKRKEDSGQ